VKAGIIENPVNFQQETTTIKINGNIRKMQNQITLGKTKTQVFFIKPDFFFFPIQSPRGEGGKGPPSLFYFFLFCPFKP
jgi:hypothetical protein